MELKVSVAEKAWTLLAVARDALPSDNQSMRLFVHDQIADFLDDNPEPGVRAAEAVALD